MDVTESSDAHQETAASSGGRERSRVPAQTTSRAGQPAQMNSLGVGRNSPARILPIASESSASSAGVSARAKVVETTASGRSRK